MLNLNWLLRVAHAEGEAEAAATEAVEAVTEAVEEVVEAAAEAEPTWLQTAFEKFAEMPVWGWVLLAVLLVGGVVLWRVVRGEKRTVWTTRMVSLGAVCIALSSVLSMIRLWKMPMGGSITPASMLPMMLFAYVYGVGPGCTLGIIYGLLQFILDGGNAAAYGIAAMLLDYPIAFGMMGLAGSFRKLKDVLEGLTYGVALACEGRFLSSFLSGWIFYGIYASDYGFNSPVVYSIVYNIMYMLPECIICVLLALMMSERLIKELKKQA